ncbi:MAG: hypothetical protein MZU91_12610 [Desulfosudis oleivorans]|nr:hypothetical protein [Desulfosudis oleivorans]
MRLSAHASEARCKQATIALDTDLAGNPQAFNPAELLLAALVGVHDQGHRARDADPASSSCAASRCTCTACARTCRRRLESITLRDRRRHRRARPAAGPAARQRAQVRHRLQHRGTGHRTVRRAAPEERNPHECRPRPQPRPRQLQRAPSASASG